MPSTHAQPAARILASAACVALVGAQASAVADADTPAVGALVDDEQRVQCSAALLTPDAVLTAAHCVARAGVVRWPWGFFIGDDVRLGGEFVRVVDGAVHPDYDEFLHTADLAVLRIAGGAPRSDSLALDDGLPADGDAVRVIGFGADSVGPNARDAEVVAQAADSFRYEPGSCPGDSGGPVLVPDGDDDDDDDDPFDSALIAGVVSTGAAGCASARAVAVAAHLDWIADAVAFVDPVECRGGDGLCGPACPRGDADCACVEGDGACRLCAGVDLDCSAGCESDGACVTSCLAPDPDCRTQEEGAACERDVECASSICFDRVCRDPCAPASGAGCPPWLACLAVGAPGAAGADAGPGGEPAGVCVPPRGPIVQGGCAAAGRGAAAPPLLALLLWFLAAARRRPIPRERKTPTKRKGERT
jgi:hypothetical protein